MSRIMFGRWSLVMVVVVMLTIVLAIITPAALAAGPNEDGILYVEPAGLCGGNTPCYDDIQEAVWAARNGDTVRVSGTYTNVRHWMGVTQTVYVSSSLNIEGGWDSNFQARGTTPTVLDAQGEGRVIVVNGPILVQLSGVNIIRGVADSTTAGSYPDGGGVYIVGGAEVEVRNCAIYSNTATNNGGGIYVFANSTLHLIGTVVHSNSAQWGGGIYLYGMLGRSDLYADGLTLGGNDGLMSGDGIFAAGEAAVNLTNSIIAANDGNGLYAYNGANVSAVHTTWSGNGIAIYADASGSIYSKNSIFAYHSTAAISGTTTVGATVEDIIWYSNTVTCGIPSCVSMGGIYTDPKFISIATGNYHIQSDSPAVNAAECLSTVLRDVDGDNRGIGGLCDLGADEVPKSPTAVGLRKITVVSQIPPMIKFLAGLGVLVCVLGAGIWVLWHQHR